MDQLVYADLKYVVCVYNRYCCDGAHKRRVSQVHRVHNAVMHTTEKCCVFLLVNSEYAVYSHHHTTSHNSIFTTQHNTTPSPVHPSLCVPPHLVCLARSPCTIIIKPTRQGYGWVCQHKHHTHQHRQDDDPEEKPSPKTCRDCHFECDHDHQGKVDQLGGGDGGVCVEGCVWRGVCGGVCVEGWRCRDGCGGVGVHGWVWSG